MYERQGRFGHKTSQKAKTNMNNKLLLAKDLFRLSA